MQIKKLLIVIVLTFFVCVRSVSALNVYKVTFNTGTNIRSGASTKYEKIGHANAGDVLFAIDDTIYPTEYECASGWYKVKFDGDKLGYVCSNLVTLKVYTDDYTDKYYRPWTSPKLAITGGALYISSNYINKGQFTLYLKKFNVNPNGYYAVYNHQYMTNIQGPYSEAYSSYRSYSNNGLLSLPLEFTIPIYENMPEEYTALPGGKANTTCQNEVTDKDFEALLDEQKFPEDYKCKLRLLHNDYPNWKFTAMHTGLDFEKSVTAEKAMGAIQGGEKYYDMSKGEPIETERGWYLPNKKTTRYYLDPRNFLVKERILMFESLEYSKNYTSKVVQTILDGTFMSGSSLVDNEKYSKIFVSAGKEANASPVYLAGLARQESGVNGSKATSGAQFTYKSITYKGLYNFFNIGAFSSEASPILAGLVWAAGGSSKPIVADETDLPDDEITPPSNPENPEEPPKPKAIAESKVLKMMGVTKKNGCILGLKLGMTVKDLKAKITDVDKIEIDGKNKDVLKTGMTVKITSVDKTYTYTIVIKGDVDGNGKIGATDYVKIKNYIMETKDSSLSIAESLAADVDNNGEIGATDYVKVKKTIMEG